MAPLGVLHKLERGKEKACAESCLKQALLRVCVGGGGDSHRGIILTAPISGLCTSKNEQLFPL